MAVDFETLAGGEASSRSKRQSYTHVTCALAVGMMLGALASVLNNSNVAAPEEARGGGTEMFASRAIASSAQATGIGTRAIYQGIVHTKAGYQLQRPSQNPWERLAIAAIEANNRRGTSMKATVADEVKDKIMKAAVAEPDVSLQTDIEKNEQTLSSLDSLFVSDDSEVKDVLSKTDAGTKEEISKMNKALVLKASEMAGVTAPFGFWDPLGFSTDCPEGKLLFYREVELKHGRVGMLASLGILVAEQFHPLWGGDIEVPAYVQFQATPLQQFWPAVLLAVGILETYSVFSFNPPRDAKKPGKGPWTIRSDHEPGNFGFDPLSLKPTDPKELKELQTKEINNGRLAMIAAAGMLAQELATGQKIF